MTIQTFDFVPSQLTTFQFIAQFDGQPYTVNITWNIYRRDWYYTIYSASNVRVVTQALIGSPPDYDINLLWGYFFTSTLIFRQQTQQFEVGP